MAFDPYETWLGIPTDRRPHTHYDMLGLTLFESDPDVIDQAALRRMSRIRQHQIGPHSDLSQEILAELARARLILMDPDRRADYDAKLRAHGESGHGPLAAPQNVGNGDASRHRPGPDEDAPGLPDSLALTEPTGHGSLPLRATSRKATSWWKKGLVLGAIAATHATLFGAFYYFILGPRISNQKPFDSVRNDPAPLTSTPKQKPPAMSPKPAVTPKQPPPLMVERLKAGPPGEGGKSPTPSVATHREEGNSHDSPSGLGQNKPSGTGADPRGRILPPNDDPIAEQDPIAVKLDTARKDYRAKMLRLLDGAKKTAKKSRNSATLKKIQDERDAFESQGEIPIVFSANPNQKQAKAAVQAMIGAYESARRDYIKAGKRNQVDKISKEREQLERDGIALDGWKPLLRGDLRGWIVDPEGMAGWRVEGGELTWAGPELCWLLSEKSYSDFRLRFEFTLPPEGDTGVAILAGPGEPKLEIQMRTDQPVHVIHVVLGRSPDLKPPNEWNNMEATLLDKWLYVSINGKQVFAHNLEVHDRLRARFPGLARWRGRIGFQGRSGTVRFRKMMVKELPVDVRIIPSAIGQWNHQGGIVELMPDGTIIRGGQPVGFWKQDDSNLTLRWPGAPVPEGAWIDIVKLSEDGRLYEGKNQTGGPISGSRP
jgi:hypothetical protein